MTARSSCERACWNSSARTNSWHRDVSLTSSRQGVPSYDLRTGSMLYDDKQEPVIDPQTGQALVDAEGEFLIQHTRTATSRSNTIYFGQTPVFYWPYMSTNLEEPSYYIRDIQLSEDRIFGTAALPRLECLPDLRHQETAPGNALGFQHRLPQHARAGGRHVVHL